jgi:hypothetical protein
VLIISEWIITSLFIGKLLLCAGGSEGISSNQHIGSLPVVLPYM